MKARDFVKKRALTEMPGMAEPIDFGLGDAEWNRLEAIRILNSGQIIEETPLGVLMWGHDEIACVDPQAKRIRYYAALKNGKLANFAVTQVAVWRERGNHGTVGMPQAVIFNNILKKWPIIVSDYLQTSRGKAFWENLMAEAVAKNYRVAVTHLGDNSIIWYDPVEQNFTDWLSEWQGAWGYKDDHQNFRFLISQK